MEKKVVIFDIQKNSYVDGPGIRTTVFFKGCNLHCAWCHNPESQNPKIQMMVYKDKCTGCGKCKEVCPYDLEKCDFCGKCEIFCPNSARKICGKEMTVDEIFEIIVKDKIFYSSSGGGVTFSGGECMLYSEFLTELLKKCKEENIHTAVDTAGCVTWESFEKVIPYTDLFLYDIKAVTPDIFKKYVGADNALILENLRKLIKKAKSVWIRVPIIPGVNNSVEEMKKLMDFLGSCKPDKIELLPYHKMGENKYNALGMPVHKFSVPEKDEMEALKAVFE